MISKISSGAIVGLDAQPVDVEVDVSNGMPSLTLVGLPDKAVQESRERVKSAIQSTGIFMPSKRIVINLAPADLRKEGPAYDLPIAVGVLASMGLVPVINPHWLFMGELSLDGGVKHVDGVLCMTLMAKALGYDKVLLPAIDAREAALIESVEIIPIASLGQLMEYLNGNASISPQEPLGFGALQQDAFYEHDMKLVKGQEHAKRALEIAAAGGHNVLMTGPPGSGKTLLARTIPSILPKLALEEALEVTKIYSVSGSLPPEHPIMLERPFRSPHHTTSRNALVGGGTWPRPGEISLAHRGVLFLDEFPEFPAISLESLRQPLEDGVITVSRVQGSLTFPAEFILIAAMNPCPCGFATDTEKPCRCTSFQIDRYQKRISGPLLDRIDLHIDVPRIKYDKLSDERSSEPSVEIRARVEQARERQRARFLDSKTIVNGHMSAQEIRTFCRIDESAQELLRLAVTQMHLSGRAYHRILKLARTIADLGECSDIATEHIAEAIQYRPREQAL
jgi:magnesium chelatase family protein